MTTLFVDHLTVIDFSYIHPSRGFIGESWIVDMELSGQLDEEGVIFDFAYAKKALKDMFDTTLDHTLAVPTQSGQIALTESGLYTKLQFTDVEGAVYSYSCPASALCKVDTDCITQRSVQHHLEEAALKMLPNNVEKVVIRLREEPIDGAYYHYSHGLKKHYGNCQRIVHGHRSRLHILKDNERSAELEHIWAKKWEDIYIGTVEDLNDVLLEDGIEYYLFEYTANQGNYSLKIPKKKCDLISTDSTVEWIAHHIATEIKKEHPTSLIQVKAFEGVDKGAMVSL